MKKQSLRKRQHTEGNKDQELVQKKKKARVAASRKLDLEKLDSRFSPNSACTMGFWRFQGLVKVGCPCAVPGHAKSLKNHEFSSFFKKNGAGARVLESTFSFFDECFI